jgi:uncharacterized OB-fold protein
MSEDYKKPLPKVNAMTQDFWEGCKKHQLRIQRCDHCQTHCHPPQPMCHNCNSMEMKWSPVQGTGKIYSYIVPRQQAPGEMPVKGFEYPYAVAMIELDGVEEARFASSIVGCELEDIKVGMPVEVVFEDVTEEVTLPLFRLA